jgi:hypothetical protein
MASSQRRALTLPEFPPVRQSKVNRQDTKESRLAALGVLVVQINEAQTLGGADLVL